MHKTVNFLGIRIGALTSDEMVEKILVYALTGKNKFITYLNAHCVNICFADPEYKEILQKADLVYTGGQGVVWAARFFGVLLPERVNILDFFDKLAKGLKEKEVTIYLFGGVAGVAKKAEEALRNKGLKILGSRGGFFGRAEEAGIIREINILRPDILMVGMGVPKQEKWIRTHLNELDVHLCWAVGAVFDWLSGKRKRAPVWMIRCGLEWLHRLFQQPKRLWKRCSIGNFIFVYRVLEYKIKNICRD